MLAATEYDNILELFAARQNSWFIIRAKWPNSRKNISLLKCYKLRIIILQVKCYAT